MSYGEDERIEMEVRRGAQIDFIQKRIKKGVWTQKDGSNIDITFMTSSHIRNCIKMLQRKEGWVAEAWLDRFSRELSFRDYIKRIANGELDE